MFTKLPLYEPLVLLVLAALKLLVCRKNEVWNQLSFQTKVIQRATIFNFSEILLQKTKITLKAFIFCINIKV